MRELYACSFSFNTQPPEGGWFKSRPPLLDRGGFQHTAARRRLAFGNQGGIHKDCVSTHSRPKAAGAIERIYYQPLPKFQHTAARRRLGLFRLPVLN